MQLASSDLVIGWWASVAESRIKLIPHDVIGRISVSTRCWTWTCPHRTLMPGHWDGFYSLADANRLERFAGTVIGITANMAERYLENWEDGDAA